MSAETTKQWRKVFKQKVVEGFGGKCCLCGYSACNDALDFHHIDPSIKDFSLGQIMSHPKRWAIIVEECQKGVLLCANCHREIHAGYKHIDEIAEEWKFDENRIVSGNYNVPKFSVCDICLKPKPRTYAKKCTACAKEKVRKILLTKEELEVLYEKHSALAISKMYGVSSKAIDKKLAKFGIKKINPQERIKKLRSTNVR
jgi:hypothetical protein